MKKLIIILCILAAVCCFASCSADKNTIGITEPAVSNSESKPKNSHKFKIFDLTEREKKIYFYRNDLMIYGKLYLPEGEGPFPVAIFSPGMQALYNSTENYTRALARNGIAGLSFEFTGSRNKSEGSFSDSSLLTQAAELDIIMDVVASLPEIDSSNLFLLGHSFGGITSAYVAAQRPDDVKALVLLEPSLYIPDQYREMYPQGSLIPESPDPDYPDICKRFVEDIMSVGIYEMISGFDKEVLMFKGTVCPEGQEETYAEFIATLETGVQTFPNAHMATVEGADHGFHGIFGNRMIRQAIEFLQENID